MIFFLSFGVLLFLIFNGYKYFDVDKLNLAYIKVSAYVDSHIILACLSYVCVYILTVFFFCTGKTIFKDFSWNFIWICFGFHCLFICSYYRGNASFFIYKI
ncbi:putative membrane protein [Francisella tularensis subsp. tularensis str. SCHU S4 substr. NR-28534]|nr:putative membrane protein [Francisella tularensis subsp. tularensis str. SCHU S4 substr. NR-28534]